MNKKLLNAFEFVLILLCFYFQRMINFNNIDFYIISVLLLVFFKSTKDIKYSKDVVIFSFLFSFIFSFGNLNILDFKINSFLIFVTEILGFFFLFSRMFFLLKNNIKKINIFSSNKRISSFKFIFISTIIGFILLMPYFLRHYPGVITTDSLMQIFQVRGFIPYSNHHPWIHTLIIKCFYDIGFFITHDPSKSIAFYTIFQMLMISLSFSYVTYVLYKNNIKKVFVILVWMFFFLFPFNAIYAVSVWKDILFSCLVLIFTTFLWDHYENNYEWDLFRKIVFIILSFLICLMRSNGLFAYILFLISLLLLYRKELFKLRFSLIIVIILVLIFKLPIMSLFNVSSPDFVESLSIPLQQVAYVIKNDGNISNKEINEIKKIADIDRIKNQSKIDYYYNLSDPVKNNIREHDVNHYLDNNKPLFLKLWIKIGIKNPVSYMKAFVLQTSGYWYHNYGEYWVYTQDMKDTSPVDGVKLDIYQKDLSPSFLSKFIDKSLDTTSSVYYYLWSPAMSFYVILIGLFISLNNKKNILSYVLCISILITLLIAAPVSCEFRYAYSLFICFPILFIGSIKNKNF